MLYTVHLQFYSHTQACTYEWKARPLLGSSNDIVN